MHLVREEQSKLRDKEHEEGLPKYLMTDLGVTSLQRMSIYGYAKIKLYSIILIIRGGFGEDVNGSTTPQMELKPLKAMRYVCTTGPTSLRKVDICPMVRRCRRLHHLYSTGRSRLILLTSKGGVRLHEPEERT